MKTKTRRNKIMNNPVKKIKVRNVMITVYGIETLNLK